MKKIKLLGFYREHENFLETFSHVVETDFGSSPKSLYITCVGEVRVELSQLKIKEVSIEETCRWKFCRRVELR